MKRIKVLIVGWGKIAYGEGKLDKNSHFGAIEFLKNKIILSGISEIKKKKYHKNFSNIIIERNLNLAIKKTTPDVIAICTTTNAHFEVVKSILVNKFKTKLIFLEKPCFNNYDEFKKIHKLIKKKRTKIIINHPRRFDPNFFRLKNLIVKKKFGKLKRVNFYYYNGFKHNAVHFIDLLYYLFNDSINVLKAKKSLEQDKNNINIDVVLKFNKLKSIIYGYGYSQKPFQIFDIDFHFEKKRILVKNFFEEFCSYSVIKNSFNENILKGKKNLFKRLNHSSPMINAYNVICNYLNSKKNFQYLKNTDFLSVKKTMKTIYEIEKKI